MIAAATLSGTIQQYSYAFGESGLSGVSVVVTDASGDVLGLATTAYDGTYSLPVLPGSNYNVQVDVPDGFTPESTSSVSETISMSAGQAYTFDSVLDQDAVIGGDIITAAGAGEVDAVTLTDGAGNTYTQTYVTGSYSFDVPPGQDYTVSFVYPSSFSLAPIGIYHVRTVDDVLPGESYIGGGNNSARSEYVLDAYLVRPDATFASAYTATGLPSPSTSGIAFTVDDSPQDSNPAGATFTLSGEPAGMNIYTYNDRISSAGYVSWIPSASQADQTFTFTYDESWTDPVTGLPAGSVSQQATVYVRDFPSPLATTIDPMNDETSVTAGSSMSFIAQAYDPSGGAISYIFQGAPDGAIISGGTFSWTPAEWQVGTTSFDVVAVYADNAFQIDPVIIDVRDFENPLPDGLTVPAGTPVTFQASAYDPTPSAASPPTFGLSGARRGPASTPIRASSRALRPRQKVIRST